MKTITFEDLEKANAELEDLKSKAPEVVETAFQTQYELLTGAYRTHQAVQSATGLKFDEVVLEGGPENAAAFITHADSRTYVGMSTLMNEREAVNAGFHEKEHKENQVFSFNLKDFLNPDDISILEEKLSIPRLAEVDLIEGFTHAKTLKNTSADNYNVYSHEVKTALKLEDLCRAELNISLMDLFNKSTIQELKSTLKMLCVRLQTRKALSIQLAA